MPRSGIMGANVASVRIQFAKLLNDHDREKSGALTGQMPSTDDPPMLEIIGASFIADEPTIIGMPDFEYVTREVEWYDRMSRNVHDIRTPVPKIWRDVADEECLINSNYGFLVYSNENGRQYEHVRNELLREPYGRRASMIYTRPTIHEEAGKDFICTNAVTYFIRDDALHAVVQMRSNDAVFGYRNDFAWQKVVQTRLWRDIKPHIGSNLRIGQIVWQVQSLHIYPRHVGLLRDCLVDDNWYRETK